MDFSYHRDPYTAPQHFKQPYKKSDFYATGTSVGSTIKTMADSGFDTMRRALSEAGLGWSPKTSVTTKEGARELAQTWTKRAGAAVGAAFGMRLLDAGTDVAIPDDMPGGEGITTELSEIAANARLSASKIYETLGITDAAQYMEGLAPKSTSTLPGAAAGMYATNSILGAVAGATLNRALQPVLENTPFESLSILPPLAPFVSDMSESYETTRAKYEGRQWIPQRSGRFYMLSSSNYEGEGIESYRPNWYVREKSDYQATPVQYGSKFEEAVFKDLPLIDIAPGDLLDPQYLDRKHACLTPDSKVVGPKVQVISDVQPGDEVYTKSGESAEVLETHSRQVDEEIYEIDLATGAETVRLTGNHKVLVLREGQPTWVRTENLDEQDQIAHPKAEGGERPQTVRITEMTDRWPSYRGRIYHARCATENSMKAAYIKANESWPKGMPGILDEMSEKHGVDKKHLQNLYRIDEDQWDRWSFPDEVEITPDFARLLGYFLAEGSAYEGGLKFAFDKSERETLAADVVEICESYGWPSTVQDDSVEGNGIVVSVSGVVPSELMSQLVGTAKDKHVPGIIFSSPATQRLEFLRGYLHGDGCISEITEGKSWYISYVSAVPDVAYGIQRVLATLGLWASVSEYDQVNKVVINGEIRGSTTGSRYRGSISGWQAEQLSDLLDLQPPLELKPVVRASRQRTSTDNYEFIKVRSISKEHYTGPVYDLTVNTEDEGNYLTTVGVVHNSDRPYAEPSAPLSEVPVIGPALGATVGKAYSWAHPLGTTKPIGMEGTVGAYGPGGEPRPGLPSGGGRMAPGQAQASQDIQQTASSAGGVLDESFYRTTEAMGFTGFLTQQAAGGESLTGRPTLPSGDRIDSAARSYHDLKMGDMLGIGEAARRLQPYERGNMAQGPRNQMPDWMGAEMQRGDPYCLHPDTLMDANEDLERAEDVYQWVKEGKEIVARTHEGNLKEIEAAEKRPVDEDIVKIETSLPWDLEVTEEHPVLVHDGEDTEWRLAGDIEEGDRLLDPMGPEHPELVTQRYRPLKGHPYQWTRPQNAETVDALQQIRDVEPPPKDRFQTNGLDEDEILRLDFGMGLSGSPRSQRKKKAICRLCREMQERGFPPTIVGTEIGPLRPLIRDWGEMDMDALELHIPITPERIRPDNEEWGMWEAYKPERSDEEATRSAAYRLLRALTNATTIPCRVEKDGDAHTVVLSGRDAAWHLFSYYVRSEGRKRARRFRGKHERENTDHGQMAVREVTSVERKAYEGPVYAFQVADDSSFVAAGVATHNSQVAMGEALLPGEGLEATGKLTGGEAPIEASDIGKNSYDAAMNMLGIQRSKTANSWAKQAVKKRMVDSNMATRTDAVYVDEQSGLTAVADAATKSNQPIHIRSMSDAEFDAANQPRKLDTMKVNAMLGAADRTRGMIAQVNEETGEVKTHIQKFDSGLYNETLAQLQEGRQMAKKYAQQGYGKDGAMYSSVDRLQVLMNSNPFGDKWQVEKKKAQKKYYSGNMNREEKQAYERIKRQHDKMRQPFEMHEKRFETDELLNPDKQHTNRSYNDNVKAASEYSLPERLAGSVWESACFGPNTPIETPHGNKPISEIEPGDRVLSRDGEWNQVEEVHSRPVAKREPVIRLTAAGHSRPVYVTPNHEVMAARGKRCLCPKGPKEKHPKKASACPRCRDRFDPEMVEVGELRPGDYLAVRRPEFSDIEEFVFTEEDFDAEHLNKVDGWWYASKHPKRCKYGVPERVTGDELGDLYEVLGWYLSEGSIHTDRQVTFTLHRDEEEYAERIGSMIERVFDTQPHHVTDRFGDKQVRIVRVGNKTLARFFHSFGKKRDKHLPQEYIPDDPELLKRLLRGFLLGDGYFHYNSEEDTGRVTLNQCTPGVSNPVRQILIRLGYTPSRGKYRNGERSDGSTKYHHSVSVYGEDAAEVWQWCKDEEPPFDPDGAQGTQFNLDNKYVLYRIQGYKPGKQRDTVFDLTVEAEPSYTTSIVTAHNSSMRSPLHTKFFGNYSPKEQYERRVLLQRDYQSWSDPVDDFVQPYTHGALAADDPMQGAVSWGLGGATFGNPAIGAGTAIAGAAYGAGRQAYEQLGGSDYVPGEIQEQREKSRMLDRAKYYRAKRLRDATGSQKYVEQMQETATGWTQQGLEGNGWAKNRRRAYAPANRNESRLFTGDEGFSSPWQGIQKVDEFADAIRKHTDDIVSIGRQKLKDFSKIGPAMRQNAQRATPNAKKIASQSHQAGGRRGKVGAQRMSEGSERAQQLDLSDAHAIAPSQRIAGLSETGIASAQRGANTSMQSGRGFGSPYQGEDPERAVNYKARDPDQSALPPEMLTAFGAAPPNEKDFLRPFLTTSDPEEQKEILEMSSPQMAAILDTGWSYLQGKPPGKAAAAMYPNRQLSADLTAHPVMGKGANMDSYKIKTLEEAGIAADDAGMGWKDQMTEMEGAMVEPTAIDSVQDLTREDAPDGQEIRQIIRTALLQMNVPAEVSVESISGPTEIHLRQSE
jgi:intein/homing endonuclease